MSISRKIFAFLFGSLLALSFCAVAQQTGNDSTLIFKHQNSVLHKVIFDDNISKLILVDTSGVVIDNAVIGFTLTMKKQGTDYTEQTTGSFLTMEMAELLEKKDSSSVIFFKDIRIKDELGNIIEMPDFQFTFGNAIQPQKKK